ncbi:hypothetical protein [Streptomyces mirabilis]|uniref:Polymer-forming protein n=1 Tax=Streptomyces mirabilis TaxID=68239 RepID=A0ABU3UQF7_9ACTN|nr:hypothetical protein [Streptomyces mirabilis]MCX4610159.1 hypothetical protein [Streptomyces mirabilis]MDU8996164.1 hypothetical protein [Streptomyces mirabilis]
MGDNKNAAVFNFGEGDITFGGSVVMGDQVAVSGGVVYGDVVMGSGAKSEDTDGE